MNPPSNRRLSPAVLAFSLFLASGCAFHPASVGDFQALLGNPRPEAPGTLAITFFEVGIGDAFLIEFPSGKTLLIDGGIGWHAGQILNYLEARGIRRLDGMLLTHPHLDHYGGMERIVEAVPVGVFFHNGVEVRLRAYTRLLDALERRGVPQRVLRRGDRLEELSEADVLLETLYPDEEAIAGGGGLNRGTLVLRLTHGGLKFLLTGDAESPEERRLLELEGEALRADVLKLGHHASPGSGTAAFLRAVKPAVAVAQGTELVNFALFYPRPSYRIRRHLRENGAELLTVRNEGAIQLLSDGAALRWRSITRRPAVEVAAREASAPEAALALE
jgi:competence protein ComEC